jgi:2,3-dihydro-2,3-dihydroxybenzoate dehydrogenase
MAMTPVGDLHGRLAVVTGAASGIGAAVAQLLAERGARIAAVDSDCEGVHTLARAIDRRGYPAVGYPLDVRDLGAVDAVVGEIERDLGAIDILVNVAGVLCPGSLLDMSAEDWVVMIGVNATGVLAVSRAVSRSMVLRRSGTIVTVASNAGFVPRIAMGGYAASKAASAMLTRCLGLELAAYGVRCNVVSPGSTDTPMLRSMWQDDDGARETIAGRLDQHRLGIPLGKLAQPDDVARAVAFLVSDEASHITLENLCVDGGASLGR